ncbi:MAG: hypothetical protein RL710_2889, partial [Pseudomonadota bacterium]
LFFSTLFLLRDGNAAEPTIQVDYPVR